MAGLTLFELKKRDNYNLFLKKIQTDQDFELISKKQRELGRETVKIDKSILSGLDNAIFNKKLFLKTTDGLEITSGALKKTWEFGGMTSEMIYQKEIKQQKSIENVLKNLTVFGLKSVVLNVKTTQGKTYRFENVFSIKSPKVIKGQRRKADFEFINKEGQVIFRISHKFGKKAKHFRQWSGIKEYQNHPEVAKFGLDLKDLFLAKNYTVFPPMFSVGRPILDPELKKSAIFGNDEVDFMVQGECKFTKENDFEFSFEAPLVLGKDEDLNTLPDTHKPILLARRGDLKRGAFGIKGCRGMIYPQAGRKIHQYL